MAELRRVDPRTLKPNPDNPRRTPVPKEMDQQLIASITAIGLLQPPVVREIDGELVIRAGDRRTRAAIAAELPEIDVYVIDAGDDIDPMVSMSENLVRVGMNPIDTWRGIDKLEQQGWNEEAIGNALALPPRTVRKLKLLGKLHPPMLDVMARGSMPNDEQLRTIANSPLDDQEQVWKKFKPKKGNEVPWWEISHALGKQRIPFSAAKFDSKLAEEYGVVWLEDLFAPAGEDSRYTTNVEGFFGAQQAWMTANLPKNGTILTIGEYGSPVLPKGAERSYGRPTKADKIGHYIDPRSGEIQTVIYRPPEPKKKATRTGPDNAHHGNNEDTETPARQRPDVTQKGLAMIGDFRTDALHQALRETAIDDTTLVALLVLALAGRNVTIQSGLSDLDCRREKIAAAIAEGGVLTADLEPIRVAARRMLTYALSCRANMSDSGITARIAGVAINADTYLPSMATEDFLHCLARQALERSAAAEGVRVEPRVKDTRAGLVERFKEATWHFPGARFALTEHELKNGIIRSGHWIGGYDRTDNTAEQDHEEFEGDTVAHPDGSAGGGNDDEYPGRSGTDTNEPEPEPNSQPLAAE